MKTTVLFIVAMGVLAGGCGLSRGIPSHGGGKRFDEEQRIVACSIRQALGDMDLAELDGRQVRVIAEALGHEGSGSTTWPGVSHVSVGGHISRNEEDPYQPRTARSTEVAGVSGTVGFQPRPNLSGGASTASDLGYLKSVLEMMLRLRGASPAAESPEATLVVLVDVLGINRSRNELFLSFIENYQASCELTYYALDSQGRMLFGPRQVGACALYRERHDLGFCRVARSTRSATPLVPLMRVRPPESSDSRAPSTGPADN